MSTSAFAGRLGVTLPTPSLAEMDALAPVAEEACRCAVALRAEVEAGHLDMPGAMPGAIAWVASIAARGAAAPVADGSSLGAAAQAACEQVADMRDYIDAVGDDMSADEMAHLVYSSTALAVGVAVAIEVGNAVAALEGGC